jgi:ubiquinone/menaquinone biosynthesis C-methylase UbiE
MKSTSSDPQSSKEHASEIERWNAIAEGWHKWTPIMRAWYAPATELMLDLARIDPGSRVLDIAAGDGDQSLEAAGRVGTSGYVLAIDRANKLLVIAEQSAKEAGLSNLETRLMDGENLTLPDASFDAVICRFALMYFNDPVLGLQGIKRVLKQGGWISLVVYGENGSPEFSLALSTVRRWIGIVNQETKAAAHSLGTPGVLEQTLTTAGYSTIEVHALTLPVRMDSAAKCVDYLQNTSPTLRELLLPYSPESRNDAWQAVTKALSEFEGPNGFEVQHRVLVAAGNHAE